MLVGNIGQPNNEAMPHIHPIKLQVHKRKKLELKQLCGFVSTVLAIACAPTPYPYTHGNDSVHMEVQRCVFLDALHKGVRS